MIVSVGPLPSASVLAYTQLAREQLDALRRDPSAAGVVGSELVERFDEYHREWEQLASAQAEFHWQRELDPEEAAWIAHGFHRAAERVAEAVGPPPGFGEGGLTFYRALVTCLLDALEREGSTPGFACELRTSWPFLADVPPGEPRPAG